MGIAVFGAILMLAAADDPPAPVPAGSAAAPTAAQTGVTSYQPSFFDEFHPVTASDMVFNIPGFSFEGGGSARGFSANAGNVLIDGKRPPSGNDSIYSVVGRIPASTVLRIDVIRGGAPGIDMQGKTVVANIVRKPNAGITGAAQGGLSTSPGSLGENFSLNAQRQQAGRSIDGSASGNRNHNESQGSSEISTQTDPDGHIIQQSRSAGSESTYQNYSLTGAIERPAFGGDFRANTKLDSSTNEYQNRTLLIVPGGEQVSANSGEGQGGELGLRYSRTLKSGVKFEGVFLQQLHTNESGYRFTSPTAAQVTSSSRDNGQSVVTGTFSLPKKGNLTFNGGAEAAYNWFESGSRFDLNGSHVFIPGDTTDGNEIRGEAFGSAAWTPRPKVDVEFALRYERSTISIDSSGGNGEQSLAYLKPRANLNWRPAEGHEIKLTIEREVGQLSFYDFEVSQSATTGIIGVSNPDLRPDQDWTFSANYEHTFGKRGNISLGYSHTLARDLIGSIVLRVPATGTTPAQVYDLTANVGPSVRDNFDFSTNVPLEKYGFKGGYFNIGGALNFSSIDDPVTGVRRRESGQSPYYWHMGLNQELKDGKFTWSISASGQGPSKSFDPQTTSEYSNGPFANASISYRPIPKVILRANVNSQIGASKSTFTLYDAPRDVGSIVYSETSRFRGHPGFSVSARRQF